MGIPLTAMVPGQRGVVTVVEGGFGLRRRLAGMGLTTGSHVESIISRGRGPIVVAVRQTRLALGRGIAGRVMVEVPEARDGQDGR